MSHGNVLIQQCNFAYLLHRKGLRLLSALTKFCFCLIIAASLPCLSSAFPDEPGAPGRPEPTDWDKDFVDLKWEPPKNDGGAPITGYIVEKKERGTGKWIKAVEIPGRYRNQGD